MLLKDAWEDSYENKDNFVFYPSEEVIRFAAKFIRRKTDSAAFENVGFCEGQKALDFGCGIGRHVFYLESLGLEVNGIDLSENAIDQARKLSLQHSQGGTALPGARFVQGDIRAMPWADNYFDYAVSHGVLDSMPFEIARAGCVELSRVMNPEAYFYCDLISGDDSEHSPDYCGEETVTSKHEHGTIQSYFNFDKIGRLFDGCFDLLDCNLIRRENVMNGRYISRYHLVLENRRN